MLVLSPAFLAVAGVLLLLVHIARSLSAPLRGVPGPFIARFTSLILKRNELKGNRTRYIHGLHEKYGPVVRIAPNEVSFTSSAALKEIYCSGGSGYDKTEFYNLFRVFGKR